MKSAILTATAIAFLGFAAVQAPAAELNPDANGVKFGTASRVNVLPSGTVTLTNPTMFSTFALSMATNHPKRWFNPGDCSPKMSQPDKNTWNFTAKVPVNETDFADVEISAAATNFNTFELSYSWKTANLKNILEIGVFLNLPATVIDGGEIIINGESFKIENKTEYGWFNKKLEKAEITLFKGQEGREYTVSTGKPGRILIQSTKDQGTIIRFLPENNETELNLTITPK
jgi:hypothetical protein